MRKIPDFKIDWEPASLREVGSMLGPSSILMFRSLCIVCAYAFASSLSLKAGTELSASHQVCHQVWLGSTLLADALAIAAQTLLAQNLAKSGGMGSGGAGGGGRGGAGKGESAASPAASAVRGVVFRTLGFGLALGATSSLALLGAGSFLPGLFSDDPTTVAGIEHLLPFVVWTQPITAVAFVLDGVLYGASDFAYATLAMFSAACPAVALMFASLLSEDGFAKLDWIWAGYTALMVIRMVAIYVRMKSKGSPFGNAFNKDAALVK